jgi:uncharacterized protein (TIGR03067 family)
MKTSVLALAMIVVVPLALAPAQDGKDDQKQIQGTWKLVEAKENGNANDKLQGLILIFRDGKVTVKKGDEVKLEGRYKLDPSKSPKWIDLITDKVTFLGIYQIKGDTLTICHGDAKAQERSTKFVSEASGPNQNLAILKREKK